MNNILIVEDEHLIARLIEMTLTRAGYRLSLIHIYGVTADYREGVYVGYRWYDARKMPVRWPFGHEMCIRDRLPTKHP